MVFSPHRLSAEGLRADPSTQLAWTTRDIRVGGHSILTSQDKGFTVLGHVAQRRAGSAVEHMEATRDGVEVTWVLAHKPAHAGAWWWMWMWRACV
jgi:hypothetical protein